jgi:hypothetical protein
MDVSSGLNTSFNIQSSYAGLEKAKLRALQLHPTDDPMMHIFMSITKKGDLQFKAKETGIKRLLQRFSIRSMSSEKVKMMEVLVTHIKITNSPENVEKMMQLGKSISDIFNHIYKQRASSKTTLEKIVQADSFKEETQKVIKTLSADIMKASDIQEVLEKNYKELPKSIRHFDEEIVGKLFQLEEGENYFDLINRVVADLYTCVDQSNITELRKELGSSVLKNNILAQHLLKKINDAEAKKEIPATSSAKDLVQKELLYAEAKAFYKIWFGSYTGMGPSEPSNFQTVADYRQGLINALVGIMKDSSEEKIKRTFFTTRRNSVSDNDLLMDVLSNLKFDLKQFL